MFIFALGPIVSPSRRAVRRDGLSIYLSAGECDK